MRLPGADWPDKEARKVIRFLRYLRRSGPRLARQFDRLPPGQRPTIRTSDQPSDLIFAMAEAAELAFAIDRPKLGLNACRELLAMVPHTPMQWALWATVGALLGEVKVVLDSWGAEILPALSRGRREPVPLAWPSSAPDMVRLATALIPAAVASGPYEATVLPLFSPADRRLSPGALAMIAATPEFNAAQRAGSPYDLPRRPPTDGFTTLELRYTQRLDLLRASSDWKRLRPRGTLVDWPLLALEIGLLRQNGEEGVVLRAPPATADGFFIQELARELTARTQPGGGSLPRGQG
jgi:hypothetical protein